MAPLFWSSSAATAPALPPDLFHELKWRAIGPYRGGRTKAVTGVRGYPGLVYIGVVNGGVWKTTDYGRTWTPIFDDQPTASIGDVAVSPSNPDVIYVTSGEGLHRPDLSIGNGVYKTTDGGRTWTHLGLQEGQQIPRVIVDPKNPDRVFVAVLGHPYGPNEERGVYRSTDGGATFKRVLFKDVNTGASELEFDPSDPNVVYAGFWEARAGRRRLSAALDRSGQPGRHRRGERPGRGRQRQRRADVELVVHAADRAALSRRRRQRVPVSPVQRPAGERISLRVEPRQRRR